jgi:hypothetical protein
MAKELLIIDEDFSFRSRDSLHKFIEQDYYDLYVFDQWWPDTTCGFGGIGGQAFTQRTIYAFVPKAENLAYPLTEQPDALIYIGDRFAYKVPKSNILMDDIKRRYIRPVYEKHLYENPAKEVPDESFRE